MNENETKSSIGSAQQFVSDIKNSKIGLENAAPEASYAYTDNSCQTRNVLEASISTYASIIQSFGVNFDKDIENINVIAKEFDSLDEEMKLNGSKNF